MEFVADVLFLGKTGAGKSSFINYFIGREVAKIGKGKPVTQEDFEVYEVEVNGESGVKNNTAQRFPIRIYESNGLKALDAHKQLDYIKTELVKSNEGDVLSWFHTIFYCINAGSGRFEEFEVEFAKALQEALNQPIYFILTHCDSGDEKKIAALKAHIKKNLGRGVKIFEVVSVNMAKRVGKAEQKGVEKVRECVFELLVDSLTLRLSKKYAELLQDAQEKMTYSVLGTYKDYVEENIEFLCSGSLKEQKEKMQWVFKLILIPKIKEAFECFSAVADERFSRVLFPALQLYAACYGIFGLSKNYHSALGLDFSSVKPNLGVFSELFEYENVAHKITPNTTKESVAKNLSEVFDGFFATLQDGWNLNDVKDFTRKAKDNILDAFPSQEAIQKEAKKRLVRFLTKPRR